MKRGSQDQNRRNALADKQATYIGRYCQYCRNRLRATLSRACITCKNTKYNERKEMREKTQKKNLEYQSKRQQQIDDAKEIRRKETEERRIERILAANGRIVRLHWKEAMDGIEHGECVRDRVNYGGDNSYPDAHPYNISVRPPVNHRTPYGLTPDMLIW